MKARYIHLHVHSAYSLVDGLAGIDELVQAAVDAKMPALALTDCNNLFAMVKFYRSALSAGIKPILGSEVWIKSTDNKKEEHARLVLLCQNYVGFLNLSELLTRGYSEGQDSGVPLLEMEWVRAHTEGLIALSGGQWGDVGCALRYNNIALAEARLRVWKALFPQRFYVQIQRTEKNEASPYMSAALQLADAHAVPVVATNDVRFLKPEDFHAHEARVCIQRGEILDAAQRPRLYTDRQYFRDQNEMAALFEDLPEALENTVEIAKRCSWALPLDKTALPIYPLPDGQEMGGYFSSEAQAGLDERIAQREKNNDPISIEAQSEYQKRLDLELGVIDEMGFSSYFLIVADFIRWAKNNGVPVGPGRGSGAGSLVAYALGITNIDPMTHELLFERFLNPERVSLPDFDIDFCMEGRDRVIEYVADKYGRDSVSQIITFGTMAAKAVVRDVGRVLGYPYGFVDKLAKLIPFELGMTLVKALQQEERLQQRFQDEDEVRRLIELAVKLEGVPRNAGKHAGGVVIAPEKLTAFAPLYCEKNGGALVTQLDKDDVEKIGLVKFDFLGLRTLTIIDWALQTVNEQRDKEGNAPIDIDFIPLDDEKTFSLLQDCQTTAVFQLESRGMKDLIRRLKPDCFDEIVALVALFRPGPLQSGMVDDFIARKHGEATVEVLHPDIEPILRPTYGVILYQEQVMQIAQVLAGYSLGAADLLRRAMGKKKASEMAKQRSIFNEGAEKRGVDGDVANHIFDLMEKFAGYGFNKSHSVAYAMLSYQTAWLKAHYPSEFMAAVLSSDMDNTDKVVVFIEDSHRQGLTVLTPSINKSQYKFTVDANQKIIYGLGAIKGVGEAAIDTLLAERSAQGLFMSLFDLCRRVDTRKLNRRVLEALILSGAMDEFNVSRAQLFASVDHALKAAEQHDRDASQGQVDLFAEEQAPDESKEALPYVDVSPWPDEKRLKGEKDVLGYYFSGHPIEAYQDELQRLGAHTVAALLAMSPPKPPTDFKRKRSSSAGTLIKTAGFLTGMRVMNTKKGQRMAVLTLDDSTARLDVTVFSNAYSEYVELLVKDQLLVIEGTLSLDEFSGNNRIVAEQISQLTEIRQARAKRIELSLVGEFSQANLLSQLQAVLVAHKGGRCPLLVHYKSAGASAQLVLGAEWSVDVSAELIEKLQSLLGRPAVSIRYE